MAASDSADFTTEPVATSLEVTFIEFPFFHDSSSSDDEAGLTAEAAAQIYGRALATPDEMDEWELGSVPFDVPETMSRELKVYQIITSADASVSGITECDLARMFETSDFSGLQSHSLNRLSHMVDYYTPKYFTSFMNTRIEMAEFIIGLTDDGEVTGVVLPFDVTEENVYNMVWSKVEETIRSQCSYFGGADKIAHYIRHVQKVMEVHMVELDTSKLGLLDDWSEDFLREQGEKIRIYTEGRTEYLTEMRKVSREMEYYSRSVESMVNDPAMHDEFIEFIRTHQSEILVDSVTREKIVSEVLATVDAPMTFEVGQIADEKDDPSNMAFWIATFRDIRVDQIRASRPRAGPMATVKPGSLYTSLMLRNPVHRIASAVDAEPSLKMVVIQVVFPGKTTIPFPEGQDFHPSFAYVNSSGAYKTSVRYMTGNGPSCC
jgi:hypothetical protein